MNDDRSKLKRVCRASWCGRPISDDNPDGYCCNSCRNNHRVAMEIPPDKEEQRLSEDNLNEIIQHDIACECGLRPFCPIHDEE